VVRNWRRKTITASENSQERRPGDRDNREVGEKADHEAESLARTRGESTEREKDDRKGKDVLWEKTRTQATPREGGSDRRGGERTAPLFTSLSSSKRERITIRGELEGKVESN